jgi:hypothetical protein
VGKKGNLMTKKTTPVTGLFRFKTDDGLLMERIAEIEAMASEQLAAGVSFGSVSHGAMALLRLAVTETTGQLAGDVAPIQACTQNAEPSRLAAPETGR